MPLGAGLYAIVTGTSLELFTFRQLFIYTPAAVGFTTLASQHALPPYTIRRRDTFRFRIPHASSIPSATAYISLALLAISPPALFLFDKYASTPARLILLTTPARKAFLESQRREDIALLMLHATAWNLFHYYYYDSLFIIASLIHTNRLTFR